ncbi:MAG: DoxX family protein [Proteobacteria bacterium]|nr:DoxX family protein [Pseudomonadota bacterium]
MSAINNAKLFWGELTARLNSAGQWLPPLFIRLILFWEFWEAGIGKYNGDNWFSSIHDKFPYPFNVIPADVSWFMATWGEILFSVMLLLGLFTRFAAVSILVITVVAVAAVHWPANWDSLSHLWQGYVITPDGMGNYKLPLLYVILLMPLIFSGGGKLSLDHLFSNMMGCTGEQRITSDFISKGLALIVIGLALVFLMPLFGGGLIITGVVLIAADRFITPKA